jgi:hypothetical protein
MLTVGHTTAFCSFLCMCACCCSLNVPHSAALYVCTLVHSPLNFYVWRFWWLIDLGCCEQTIHIWSLASKLPLKTDPSFCTKQIYVWVFWRKHWSITSFALNSPMGSVALLSEEPSRHLVAERPIILHSLKLWVLYLGWLCLQGTDYRSPNVLLKWYSGHW